MYDEQTIDFDEDWVIWNGSNGLLTTVNIGRIEAVNLENMAWLDEPFDMVGPFSIDELITQGQIAFAECLVMSRDRWQTDQASLRLESVQIRRAAEQRVREKVTRENYQKHSVRQTVNDHQHRQLLNLPVDGMLDSLQIKKAFRKLAQKAHPDVGGQHDQFVRITEARDALLQSIK